MVWLFALSIVLLGGCGDTTNTDIPAAVSGTYTYNYTLSSTSGLLPVGRQVIDITTTTDSTCTNLATAVTQQFTGTVGATAGSIQIAYTALQSTYFWESIYLDVDTSGTLTPGDDVWGDSSTQVFGFCFIPNGDASITTAQTWEGLGDDLGGTSVYEGTRQIFSAPLSQSSLTRRFP